VIFNTSVIMSLAKSDISNVELLSIYRGKQYNKIRIGVFGLVK
jgi:hypothetical protein